MAFDFAQVLIFTLVALGFVFVALSLARWVSPRFPSKDKGDTYECGERPQGPAWFNFNPRFYVVALIFVVFDVEIALTFPIAAAFRSWMLNGAGWLAFVELLFFTAILVAGLAYAWRKGDLEWVKSAKE
ncbi:MAG: NADH-quinone oxidoreductase subunit A [Deltaproteobacteria bacterium]|nr:NADH-quinone oxidoreductase subunit A [Deltaproteobacteria bacterium]